MQIRDKQVITSLAYYKIKRYEIQYPTSAISIYCEVIVALVFEHSNGCQMILCELRQESVQYSAGCRTLKGEIFWVFTLSFQCTKAFEIDFAVWGSKGIKKRVYRKGYQFARQVGWQKKRMARDGNGYFYQYLFCLPVCLYVCM